MTTSAFSAVCGSIRAALSTQTSDVTVYISELFSLLAQKDANFKPNNIDQHREEWDFVFENLRSVLNCQIPFVNNKNVLTQITLNTLLDCISVEHYHQKVKTDSIRTVFSDKKKPANASCGFHEESLIEHSIMAMCIAIDNAFGSTQNLLLVGLTALLHDVGKPSCLALFGKNIGYPFHGEYGACILSQFFCSEMEQWITKNEWETMCRSINVHMCSYHSTEEDDWSQHRRTLAQLETNEVKTLLVPLSFGDTFGKISTLSDSSAFVDSRNSYNQAVSKKFDAEQFMKSNKKKTLCFFLRGKSGAGKSFFAKMLTKFLLTLNFKEFQFEMVSRDEIMASVTATRLNHKLSKARPDGTEYNILYNSYKELKLGKVVNDEMKKRISIAISQGKIPIVDSCITYYDGIMTCMPENISNAFIVAIDCVRNTVFTEEDAYKNGMTFSTLIETLVERTPLNWISTQTMCIEKLASISTGSKKSDTSYVPDLTFSHGFNTDYAIGWDMFVKTMMPVFTYFASSLRSEDTSKMNIIQYVNYLNDNFGIDGVRSTLGEQYYRTSNSHGNDHVLRMNYLEHNQHWKDAWNRQTRGTTFIKTSSEKLLPIKYLLQRGAEMMTGVQVSHGITSTESVDFGENDESYEEKISKASSSILHLDETQQKTIMNLLLNREVDMTLSFKKDGSLLGYTIFHDEEVIEFMRQFILNSGDKFAQKILEICDNLWLPFGVFSSQSTLLIGEDMLDWTVQALLSTIMSDDEIIQRFGEKTYMDAIDECFPVILLNLTNLAQDTSVSLNIPSDASVTLSFESICKDRRSIFAQRDHTELALSYQASSCTVLGISYCNSEVVESRPHFTFSKLIHQYGFIEPCFWKVTHTSQVNSLLDDLNKVIFEEMSESEFFEKNKPHNQYENWEYIIDREGFVTYTGKKFDYGKVKTDAYYFGHKLKAKNITYLMELAKILSARRSFPLCNEVSTFFSNIETDVRGLNDKFNAMCIDTTSTLYNGLPEKAKVSFPKQTPQVRLKMLINASDSFAKVAMELFSSVYPFNPERVDAEFTNDVVASVKSILMGFAGNTISFEEPTKNPGFADLFCVVRKSIQSL
jgi:hypothetical protein